MRDVLDEIRDRLERIEEMLSQLIDEDPPDHWRPPDVEQVCLHDTGWMSYRDPNGKWIKKCEDCGEEWDEDE